MRLTRTAHLATPICMPRISTPIMIPSPISGMPLGSLFSQALSFCQTETISVLRPMIFLATMASVSRIFTNCAMRIQRTGSRQELATAILGRMDTPVLMEQRILTGRVPATVRSIRPRTIMQICRKSGRLATIHCLPDSRG